MADSIMNRTIQTITTALVAVILIASVFIPVAVNQINALLAQFTTEGKVDPAVLGYTTLLGVVITVVILGIIIAVIKTYDGEFSYAWDKVKRR